MKRFDKKSIVLIVLSVLVALMMVGAIYIGTRPQKVEMTTLSPVKLSQETSQSNNFDGVIGYTAEHKTKEGETAATIPSRSKQKLLLSMMTITARLLILELRIRHITERLIRSQMIMAAII